MFSPSPEQHPFSKGLRICQQTTIQKKPHTQRTRGINLQKHRYWALTCFHQRLNPSFWNLLTLSSSAAANEKWHDFVAVVKLQSTVSYEEAAQSSSLECSILVMVQSGATPWVNSLWNLARQNFFRSSNGSGWGIVWWTRAVKGSVTDS